MIQLLKRGDYQLVETTEQTKILILDNKESYAWITASGIGDILVRLRRLKPTINLVLASGKYRICLVKGEPKITDLPHLELSVGNGVWQGYLLLTGLPTLKDNKKRITPTNEIIIQPTFNHPSR